MSADYFDMMLGTLDAVFPLDTRESLERPSLHLRVPEQDQEAVKLSDGTSLEMEIFQIGEGDWIAIDATHGTRRGFGTTRQDCIDSLVEIGEALLRGCAHCAKLDEVCDSCLDDAPAEGESFDGFEARIYGVPRSGEI